MSRGGPAILAEGLEKSYGKTRALAGLDLRVEEETEKAEGAGERSGRARRGGGTGLP